MISALITLEFEISSQLEISRECMEQLKELVLMGRNLDQTLCVHIMSMYTGASCAVWIVNA
jgi:hypothetical protein